MWIKWIATLVAFGALVQSAVACPAQCSCSGTAVNCAGKSLASVPVGIPTTTRTLSFNSNRITKLEPGVFDSLTALIVLDLGTNQLKVLPAGVFDRLVNLKELHLYSNQMEALPAGVFNSLTQLTILVLNRNQLQALPAGVFDRLGSLQRFDLSNNQLKSIPRGAFDNLKSLTHVWLHTNPWDCQCTDILYLSGWVAQHSGIVREQWTGSSYAVNPDSAKCSGTNTPVRAVTEASTSPSKCPGYVATTTTPTTTTPEIIPETTTLPQPVITTQKPRSLMNFNCSSIQERKNDGGDCGKPACTTLLNCANFLSCLCSTCALCKKR
uniref:Variable lymphocyte receptor n=1 Tax=Ichthyomyzon fossor TaxID=245073 RepID=Q4KP13_9PETR|nr:variable lymphocyte receptor [Ichthyomyzon fossor]